MENTESQDVQLKKNVNASDLLSKYGCVISIYARTI